MSPRHRRATVADPTERNRPLFDLNENLTIEIPARVIEVPDVDGSGRRVRIAVAPDDEREAMILDYELPAELFNPKVHAAARQQLATTMRGGILGQAAKTVVEMLNLGARSILSPQEQNDPADPCNCPNGSCPRCCPR